MAITSITRQVVRKLAADVTVWTDKAVSAAGVYEDLVSFDNGKTKQDYVLLVAIAGSGSIGAGAPSGSLGSGSIRVQNTDEEMYREFEKTFSPGEVIPVPPFGSIFTNTVTVQGRLSTTAFATCIFRFALLKVSEAIRRA